MPLPTDTTPTTDPSGTAEAAIARKRAGIALALLAAASGALLLLLPITVLGYTLYVLGAVVRGQPLAWQSSVAMTYTFAGIPALVSLGLLVIPYQLFRAAGRRLGTRQALLLAGGLMVVWHAGVAALWTWNSSSGFTRAVVAENLPYPIVFGVAAVIVTFVIEKRAAAGAVAFVGLLALLLSGTVRARTPIPSGVQQIHVAVTASQVRLDAVTAHAGDVYVVLDTPRSSIAIVQDELRGTEIPLTRDLDLKGCSDSQRAEDRGQQGYCGNAFKVTFSPGKYVFVSTLEGGPSSSALARLEVMP